MKPKKWLPGLPMPYYFLLLVLLLYLLPGLLRATAQAPPPAVGLAVGQRVPDNLILEMVNHSSPTAKLSDFKGKLVLLNFYGTWCSNSRTPLPLLDSLQQAYEGQLQVLLVSYTAARDNRASVEAFFQKWRNPDGSRYNMPSTVNDTALVRLFPHHRIPHFAWIGPDGTLQAITGPEKVTAANMKRALTEGVLPGSLLQEIDISKPLSVAASVSGAQLLHAAVLMKGKLDDGPSRSEVRHSGNLENGAVFANMPLLDLYAVTMRKLYPELGSKGLVLEEVDSTKLFQEKSGQTEADWKEHYTYTYDLLLPEGSAADPYRVMLDDLNRYSGLQGSLELRETDCLRLVRKVRKDKLKSNAGEAENRLYSRNAPSLQNMPLGVLVARLNSNNTLPMLVVDDTGYSGPVDIKLQGGLSDLPALRKQLQAYGLDLKPARKRVPVFVIRKSPVTRS